MPDPGAHDDELFVSDLDGTLLRSDATLSPYARSRLAAWLDAGLNFTIATARAMPSIHSILGGLPLSLPVIELDGALVTDPTSGRHVTAQAIDANAAERILGVILDREVRPFVATLVADQVRLAYAELENAAMLWYRDEKLAKGDPRLEPMRDLANALVGTVLTFTILDRFEVVQRIREKVELIGSVRAVCYEHPYCLGFWECSIRARAATKGAAIRALEVATGRRFRRLTVFGDHVNDIDMFRIADHAVAVENAAAELRELATELTESNDDDGVVRWLERSGAGTR